jgi:hypothetical protein
VVELCAALLQAWWEAEQHPAIERVAYVQSMTMLCWPLCGHGISRWHVCAEAAG